MSPLGAPRSNFGQCWLLFGRIFAYVGAFWNHVGSIFEGDFDYRGTNFGWFVGAFPDKFIILTQTQASDLPAFCLGVRIDIARANKPGFSLDQTVSPE